MYQSDYIKHRDRKRQILDFSMLKDGKRYPTDIDCLVEWRGRGYVLIELKYAGAEVPEGQWWALRTMADDYTKLGKKALVIVADHYVEDPEEDVDVSKAKVRCWYYNGQYGRYEGTVKDLYYKFIKELEDEQN